MPFGEEEFTANKPGSLRGNAQPDKAVTVWLL
jgi:hypothetical protein